MSCRTQQHSLPGHQSRVLQVRPSPTGYMQPPVVVEPWLLVPCRWEGIIPRWSAMSTSQDYSRRAVVQEPTPWSRTYFNGALVPTKSTSWVYCYKRWLGGAPLAWSEAATGCTGSGASQEVQTKISCCLCPTRGHLAWATKQSTDGCYLYWDWRCLGAAKLWTKSSCY